MKNKLLTDKEIQSKEPTNQTQDEQRNGMSKTVFCINSPEFDLFKF